MSATCLICDKHQGEGPLFGPVVWGDDLVVVNHRPALGQERTAYLGYLFVETRRHVPAIDQLTEAEAVAVGRAVWSAARAVRQVLDAEHVFSAIVGREVAHFHQHLMACHRGTPAQIPWHEAVTWDGAPRGSINDLAALAEQLRAHFI